MSVSTAINVLMIVVYIIAKLHVIRLSVTCTLRNGCSVRTV